MAVILATGALSGLSFNARVVPISNFCRDRKIGGRGE